MNIHSTHEIPAGMGTPTDLDETGANCVPSALAAYLNISTAEIVALSPDWKERESVSIHNLLNILSKKTRTHIYKRRGWQNNVYLSSISSYYETGFLHVGFLDGRGNQSKDTHVACFGYIEDEMRVYDCNAKSENMSGGWLPAISWESKLVDEWCERFFKTRLDYDYFVEGLIVPR